MKFSSSDIWSDVMALGDGSPLPHNITHPVLINCNANTLLAMASAVCAAPDPGAAAAALGSLINRGPRAAAAIYV